MADSVSVLILTHNEEINLPGCIESLFSFSDILILDSYSSDRTEQIAKDAGIDFFQRRFDNYATQRNYALQHLPFRNEWILMVDADERVCPELAAEIALEVARDDGTVSLYRMRRKDHFMGKWIRRSSGYPTWFGRLMRRGDVLVERDINEEYTTSGGVKFLQGHLLHFPFNKGVAHWVEKHNRYSSMEADYLLKDSKEEFSSRKALTSTDPVIRRKAIKKIVYGLPARPLLVFVALYFFRLGMLDGRAGLYFCMLRSFYELLIDCKKYEAVNSRQS